MPICSTTKNNNNQNMRLKKRPKNILNRLLSRLLTSLWCTSGPTAKLGKQSTLHSSTFFAVRITSSAVLYQHVISTSKQRDYQGREPTSINTIRCAIRTTATTKREKKHFKTRCLPALVIRKQNISSAFSSFFFRSLLFFLFLSFLHLSKVQSPVQSQSKVQSSF